MTLFDTPKPKPRKRDVLFERLLDVFHPTIPLAKVPGPIRERLNQACKLLREYPNFEISEIMVRKGRMNIAKGWDTPLALAHHWDEFGDVRTRQPGMPSDAEQAERRRENEIDRRRLADEQRERDRARLIVQAAPAGVAERLYQDWRRLPENANAMRYGRGEWAGSPTGTMCVRWIAERIEAMGGK